MLFITSLAKLLEFISLSQFEYLTVSLVSISDFLILSKNNSWKFFLVFRGVPVNGFSDCALNRFNERANDRLYPCIYDMPDKVIKI